MSTLAPPAAAPAGAISAPTPTVAAEATSTAAASTSESYPTPLDASPTPELMYGHDGGEDVDKDAAETTTKPVLELLPPSPTRLSFSDTSDVEDKDSDDKDDRDAARPSPISELVRICAGGRAVERAESVRSARLEVETEDGTIVRPSSRFLGLSSPFGSTSSSSSRSSGSGLFGKSGGVWGSGSGGNRLLKIALPWKRKDVTEPIRVTTSPTPSAREAPFAAEVEVKGWQIVGGRSFEEKGRVGAYVVYEIELKLRNGSTVSILRRYTEFVRLRNELRAAYPHLGQTIPPLPGKNHMRKFSPEFLEERRPRLQRFLRTVALHPEMGAGGSDSVFGEWVLGDKPRLSAEPRTSGLSAASGTSDPSATSGTSVE